MTTNRTRLYEKGFKYVPASKTNIAKTFARIRREQKKAEQEPHKVESIQRAKRKTAP